MVADFGVADLLGAAEDGRADWAEQAEQAEQRGGRRPAGTWTYMAPERLRGGRGDARSDQFSFCVAMWRALYGERPYVGLTIAELLEAFESSTPEPGELAATVSAWLEAVLRRGLAIDPDERFEHMHALVDALLEERAVAGDPSELLGDQLWATWGPPLADRDRVQTKTVAEFVAVEVGRDADEVAELLRVVPNRCRYILLRRLAVTRRSVVYAAVDRRLAREVAIKLHRSQASTGAGEGEGEGEAAMAEARTNSGVEHGNIVQIYEVGEHEGQLFSVTELCDADLQSWCVSANWEQILERIIEAGTGLAQLHAAGYVHGDVKPLNILVKCGAAKLADFGNAGRPGPTLRFAGTPGFVAPEAVMGERAASGDAARIIRNG